MASETGDDIVGEENVIEDEETAKKSKEDEKDKWYHAILFALLALVVIAGNYYFLIKCVDSDRWSANIIIGIFELLVFIRIFPSIRVIFRQIVSAFAGDRDRD